MLQTLNNYNIIGRQRWVYNHLSVGNLSRTNLGRVSFSLQQEVFADVQTSISVPIHNKPTGLAFVSSVITGDFIQSSTSATELRSMIRIDGNNINLLLGCDNGKGLPKLEIRNFVDNSVGLSAFGITELSSDFQILQVLKSNMGNIKLISDFDNLIANLEASCLDKIKFSFSYSPQGFQSSATKSLVIDASQLRFPNLKFSSFRENILSEIKLSQDFLIFAENSQSKTISINVNSHSISFVFTNKFLPDKNLQNPFISFNQLTRFENPTIFNMAFKSLEQSVFNNRESNHLAFFNPRESKERSISFSFPIPKTSQIKLNGQSSDFLTEFSPVPNNHPCLDNQLGREFIFQPKSFIGGVM